MYFKQFAGRATRKHMDSIRNKISCQRALISDSKHGYQRTAKQHHQQKVSVAVAIVAALAVLGPGYNHL